MNRLAKCIWGFAVAGVALASAAAAQDVHPGQPVPPSLAISINAVQDTVKADSAVKLEVLATNTSNQTVSFWKENAEDQGGAVYKVDVHDAQGNLGLDTKLGRRFRAREDPSLITSPEDVILSGSGAWWPLKAGASQETEINVSRLYDLSKPGKYTIQIRRLDSTSKTMVKSNSVTVTVVP